MYELLNLILSLKSNIKKLFGTEKYIGYTYFIISFLIYAFLFFPSISFDLDRISSIYSSDLATISGILIGLLYTCFGLIISSKNEILDNLNKSKGIRTVYKVIFLSIYNFVICLLIYILKIFYLSSSNNSLVYLGFLNKNIFILLLHIGIFSFVNALILLILSLHYLKKIFLNKNTAR